MIPVQQIRLVPSIVAYRCGLDWDPAKAPVPPGPKPGSLRPEPQGDS